MSHQNIAEQHVSRVQKRRHRSESQSLPDFWEILSKIHLTKRALGELNRRNTQAALNSRPLLSSFSASSPHLRKKVPRLSIAKQDQTSWTLTPAIDYLHQCGTRTLEDMRQAPN